MTREEAIKYLQDIGMRFVPTDQYGDYDDPQPYDDAIDMAIEALKDRPTGKWIGVTNGRGGHECSNCHAYAPSYMSGDENLSDFCPNCGAIMKGGDTE